MDGEVERRTRLLAWGLPVLIALVIGAFQGRVEPLGDDWEMIVNMERHSFTRAILEDTEATNMRFRPVGYANLWIERVALGLPFLAVRWIGLVAVGLVGGLVGALARRLGVGAMGSLAAALCFTCLPFHTEAYGWPSTRVDTLAAGFGIGAMIAAIERRALLAFGLFALAFLTKESAYPLAVAGWFLLLGPEVPRKPRKRDLLAAASGTAALAVVLVAKRFVTGGLLANEWAATLPWSDRIAGYLSQLRVLALGPTSSAAEAGWAGALGIVFVVVAALGVVLGLVRRQEPRSDAGPLLAAPWRALGLLLIALGCLAVTGGLPAREDLLGSRFWFLPTAFAVLALAVLVRPAVLFTLAALGVLILHANLAPYREGCRRVGVVLDRLAVEVPAHDRAVRITGLDAGLMPITYFEGMVVFYPLTFDTEAAEDRPFLSLAPRLPIEAERIEAIDSRWRAWMEAQGRTILELTWDAERGELVEVQ